MKKIFLIVTLIFVFIQNLAFAQKPNIYYVTYINRLENKIKSNWILPHGQVDKTTIITFTVDRNGNLVEPKVINSSGDSEFDQIALNAIYTSVPFEKLPEYIQDDNINISFKFNQNSTEASLISNVSCANIPAVNLKTNQSSQNNVSNNTENKETFKTYMPELQRSIKQNWHPEKYNTSKRFVALFKINKNGELESLKTFKSSENDSFDKSALEAISKTAPFEPLPPNFQEKSITILFTFDYNIHGENTNARYNFSNPDERSLLGYQKTVEAILSHSIPTRVFLRKKCLVVRITIEPSGNIEKIQIVHSSNDKHFDNLYVSAVKKCSFPSMPENLAYNNLTFDYVIQTKKLNSYQDNMVPANLSTPAGKIWAADKIVWWSFLIFCVSHMH